MKAADIPDNEDERIRKLNELNILDTIEEQSYDDLTLLAAQICNTPITLVSLVDTDRQWFKSNQGLDAIETPRDIAFCSHAILSDDLFIIEDATQDNRFLDNPLVTGYPHVKFYAGAPLVLENDIRIGTLCVIDTEPRTLTSQQKLALSALGRQVVSQLRLRLQLKELERLDHAKDEFVSMVSHELRTPLTSILGSLSLLKNGQMGELEAKPQQMTALAYRNAERLLGIVNDILDLAKIESGKFDIQLQPVNLVSLLEKAIEANKAYSEQCGCVLKLVTEPSTSDVIITGDDQRLLQVMSNLISNASKFTHNNDTIEVKLNSSNKDVRVEVTDHGAGIPEDQQGLLFQRFKQLSVTDSQKKPGTGLGLNICKQIIELHNGSIGFESIPNQRTTFYFTLPLSKS